MTPDLAWDTHMAENLHDSVIDAMNELIEEMRAAEAELERLAVEADNNAADQIRTSLTAMHWVERQEGEHYVRVYEPHEERRAEAREAAEAYTEQARELRLDRERIAVARGRLEVARREARLLFLHLSNALRNRDNNTVDIEALRQQIIRFIRDMGEIRDSFDRFNLSDPERVSESLPGNLNEVLYKAVTVAYMIVRFSENFGDNLMSAFAGDPINMATGNFVYYENDIMITGAYPLVFKRYYNALSNFDNVLCLAWTHNYNIFLSQDSDTIHITFDDGHVEAYESMRNGYYTTRLGNRKSLKQDGDGWLLASPGLEMYYFNNEGQLVCIKDTNGNATDLFHEDGLLVKVETPSGYLSFDYTEHEGRKCLTHVKDHTGRSITFEYSNNRLTKVNQLSGKVTQYKYTSKGYLCEVITPAGVSAVKGEYDQQGRTIRQLMPDSGLMRLSYDDTNMTTTFTQQDDSVIVFKRDDKFRTTGIVFEDGHESREFDENDQVRSKTDKRGNRTTYEYDQLNRLIKEIDPLGNTTEYSYGSGFGASNKITRIVKPNKAEASYNYDEFGNLLEAVNELGNCVKLTYDDKGLPIQQINEKGAISRYSYDEKGNLTHVEDFRGNITVYEYDALNRKCRTTLPEQNTRRATYTDAGNLHRLYDGLDNYMEFEYDPSDNLTAITDFAGNITRFAYNTQNKPIQKTDPLGNKFTYEYDIMWNPIKEINPNGEVVTYKYDTQGRLISETDDKGNTVTFEYDKNGNVIKITDPLGNTTAHKYDAINRPVMHVNKNGHTGTSEYDCMGNVIKITDFMGHSTSFEYDLMNNPTKTIDAMGNATLYTYDECGNLASQTDPLGNTTTYGYDSANKLISITNPLGGTARVSYNKNGNVSKVMDSEGAETVYVYDKNDRPVSISVTSSAKSSVTNSETSNEQYTHQLAYDKNGNQVAITDPRGYTKKTVYDALDREIVVIDELGNEMQITRDPVGRITKTINYEGAVTYYEYTHAGKVSKTTDAQNNTTIYTYDALNRVVSVTDPLGHTTKTTYNKLDLVESITDPLGGVRAYEYDANGNLTKETNPDGHSTTYEYNALNQRVKTTDALGFSTTFTYTPANHVASVTDKNGNTTRYKHDAAGNVIETIDANGYSSYFEYDTLNRLVKMRLYRVEDVDGCECAKDEAINGVDDGTKAGETAKMLEVVETAKVAGTSENEQVTLYQYNSQGLVTKVINHDGGEKLFIYDENGNLLQRNDEDGYITSYQYNPKNLIESINYSDEKRVYFEYDKTGALVGVQDWLGTTSFELDTLKRIIAVNDHKGNKVAYTYDPAGNKTSISYPDNTTAKYAYDALNRLTAVSDGDGQKTLFDYSPAGVMTQKVRSNGIIEKYGYDPLGHRVETMYTTPDDKTSRLMNRYAYDPQGNIVEEFKGCLQGNKVVSEPNNTRGANSIGESIRYTYDALNRLNSSTKLEEGRSRNYAFDSLGNLIRETEAFGEAATQTLGAKILSETRYQIDGRNKLVGKTTVEEGKQRAFGYAYDKRGNLICESDEMAGTQATYIYDATGKMVKGVNHAGYDSAYIFNGLDARVGASTGNTSSTTDYVMDYTAHIPSELLNITAEKNNITSTQNISKTIQRYVYAGRHKISADIMPSNVQGSADVLPSGTFANTPSKTNLHDIPGMKLQFHNDRLGSVTHVTDNTGKLQASASYDEWGNRYNVNPPYNNRPASSNKSKCHNKQYTA